LLERATFLHQGEKIVSGFERGPEDALWRRHVVAEGDDMDDTHCIDRGCDDSANREKEERKGESKKE